MGTGGPSPLKTLTAASEFEKLPTYLLYEIVAAKAAGAPSGIRTRDPLIKSQLLYQLS